MGMPASLNVISGLFGHEPLVLSGARVLVIGCKEALEFLSWVCRFNVQLVGVDPDPAKIRQARAYQDALGVKAEFSAVSILDTKEWREGEKRPWYDLIVVNAGFSELSEKGQGRLLSSIAQALSPTGKIIVRYPVLPGCQVEAALLQGVAWHKDHFEAGLQKSQAAAFGRLLVDRAQALGPWGQLCESTARRVVEQPEVVFSVPDRGMWFKDFLASVRGAGLRYFGELDVAHLLGHTVEPTTRRTLNQIAPALEEFGQYLDLVTGRPRRTSILVGGAAPRRQALSVEAVLKMVVCANYVVAGKLLDARGEELLFENDEVQHLFERIVLAGAKGSSVSSLLQPEDDESTVASLVFAWMSGFVSLRCERPPVSTSTASPRAEKFCRLKASLNHLDLENLWGHNVRVDAFMREVLVRCDGHSTAEQIAEEVELLISEGTLALGDGGQKATKAQTRQWLSRYVPDVLASLAQLGFFLEREDE